MSAKPFNLSDVLSITTGRLVSFRHMEGVYDILNHMTGDKIYTHQLGRAIEACRPSILADHPWLAEIGGRLEALITALPDGADVMLELRPFFVDLMRAVGSSDINVLPLAPGIWLEIDPIAEAAAMFGDDKIIVVETAEGSAQ